MLLLFLAGTSSAYATEETLTATNLPPAGGSITQGAQNVVGDVLKLYAPPGDGITVADITVRQVGTAMDSDISLVKLIRDANGNNTFDSGIDQVIASTTTASGVAYFTGLTLPITADSTETVLVAFDVSPGASAGATLQSSLTSINGDIAVVAPDTIADFGTLSGAIFTIQSIDTLTVTHTPPAPSSTTQGTVNVLLDTLALTASAGDGVHVTALRADRSGTSIDSDVAAVKLYRDTGDGSFDPAVDTPLGSTTFADARADFALNLPVAADTTETVFVAADLSPTASAGATVASNIADNTYITVAAPDTVGAFSALTGGTVTVDDDPDALTVGQTPVAAGTVKRSSDDNLVQVIDLSTNQDKTTVSSIAITRTGTATDADTKAGGIKLFLDSDNSNTLNAGDTQLSTAKTFTAGAVTFDGLGLEVVAGAPKKLLLTYSIAAGATLDATIGAQLSAAGAVTVTNPDTVTLTATPLSSNLQTISSSNDTLTVSHTPPAGFSAAQGATDALLDRIVLSTASGDGVTVSDVTVREVGSAVASDISLLKLYLDTNDNGTIEPGVDELKGSAPLSGSSVTFTGLALSVAPGTSQRLLVAADVSTTASVDATVQSNLIDGDIVVASPDTVASFGSFSGATLTITDAPDTLSISQSPAPTGPIARNTDDNLVQVLDLVIDHDATTVQQITLSRESTSTTAAADSDTKAGGVKLRRDDGDGTFELTDPVVAQGSFSGGTVTLTPTGGIAVSDPVKLFVTLDIAADANVDTNIGVKLASAGDVTVTSPDAVTLSQTPLVSGLRDIDASADTLTVAHSAPAPSNAQQGATNVVLDALTMSASAGDGITVTGVRVDETGTGIDADVTAMRMIEDVNTNGTYEAGTDTVLDTKTLSGGTVTFAPALSIAAGATKQLLVTADLSPTASVGATIASSIANNTYVTVASPDSVSAFTSLAGAQITVTDQADTLTVGQTAVATSTVTRSSDDNLIQVLDLSVDQDRTTVSSIAITRTGTAADADTKTSGIKLWLDNDNSNTLNAGDTQLSTSKTFSGGAVTFDALNLEVIDGDPKKLLVTYSITAGATLDATIGAQIDSAGAVTVTNPDTVTLTATPLSSNLQTISSSNDTLTVTHEPPADFNAAQGAAYQVLDVVKLAASAGDGITVTGVRVDEVGTSTDSDVTSVKLIHDTNDNGLYDSGVDVTLDTKMLAGGTTTFTTSLSVAPDTTETVLIAADVSATAQVGATVATNITNNSYISVTNPDSIVAFSALSGATLTVLDTADTLTVGQTPADTSTLARASDDNLIQILDLSVNQDTTTVSNITITRTGTVSDTDTKAGGIKLFLDNDNSNTLNAGDTQLSTAKSFSAGAVTFDNLNLNVSAGTPVKLLVTYSISPTATLNATIGSSVADAMKVSVSAPDAVTLTATPLSSNLRTIASSADTLTVTHTPPANFNAAQESTATVGEVLKLYASAGDGITVNGIKIEEVGSATDSDITAVKLIDDVNDNGVFDAGEPTIASTTTAGDVAIFNGLNMTVSADTTETVLVAFDISKTATVGATVQSSITDQNSITVASPDSIDAFSSLTGAQITVTDDPDALTVGQTPVAAGTVKRSSDDNLVQVIDLSTNQDKTTVSSIAITRTGTATDADTKAGGVKLFLDSDNSNTLNAGDTQLSTAKTFTAGAVTFDGLGLEVVAGAPKKLLLTYSITAGATLDATIGAQLSAAGAVTVTNPDTVTLTATPLSSNLQTISSSNDTLTVTHEPPADFNAAQGAAYQVLDVVKLAASAGDGITVTGVRVDEVGTSTDSDVTSVKLIHDTNDNGLYDAGTDVTLDTTTLSGGTATFATTLSVAADTTETVLIAADISATAKVGATVATNMADSSYVTVASPDAVGALSALTGATVTVTDLPDALTISQTDVTAATVSRASDDNLIQALDLTVDQDTTTVERIAIQRTGTATDADTKAGGVKLFLDADKSGTLNTGDMQLSTAKSFSSGVVTFDSMQLNVSAGTPVKLLVTYSISPTATLNATIGSKVVDAASITVSSPDTVTLTATPLASSLQTIAASGDTLTVTHTPPADFTAAQESTATVGEVLKLYASAGDGISITGIKIEEVGSATDSGITAVKLIDDVNDNGVFDAGEPTIASTMTSSGIAEFSSLNIAIQPDTTETVLVAFDIAPTATVGATVQSGVANESYITVSSPDSVAAFTALTGAQITVTDKPDTLTIGQTLIPEGAVKRASNDNVIQVLDLSVNEDKATVNTVTIDRTGTAVDADTNSDGIRLWLDADASGTLTAGDTQLSTAQTFSNGVVTFDNVNVEVVAGSPVRLLVTYSITPGATLNATIGAQIADATGVAVASPDTVTLTATPLSSNLQTITPSNDALTVTHTPPADFNAQQGTTANVVDTLQLHAPMGDGVTVTEITVHEVGTSVDSDISAIKLALDANGNGSIDTTETISSATLSGGVATFANLNLSIAQDTTETVLIGVDISKTAKVEGTVQSNLVYNADMALSDIKVAAPDAVANFGSLSGARLTVQDKPDTLTVGQTAVDGGDAIVGKGDHVMQVLDLSVNEDKADLISLTVKRIGTATDSDTAANGVKLWFDADGDGELAPTKDWQLSTSQTFTNGIATFGNIKLDDVVQGTSKKLLVTYALANDAVIDRTIGASIEAAASVGVVAPDTVTLTATPLESVLHTIAPAPPTAPTGLLVTAGATDTFTLTWKANPAAESVTTYKIFRSTASDGTFVEVGTAAATQFVDTVPSAGSYWYKLAAVNRSGESVKSAAETAEKVDLTVTLGSASTTSTIESADATVKLIIPPSPAYANKTFTIRSATRPAGVKMMSRFYYELTTDAAEPFNPALTLVLRCNSPVDSTVVMYHYNDANKWEPVTGGAYIYDGYADDYDIGYNAITKFSGYAAAEASFGGYNYPLEYTDRPKGPHGGYVDTTNKCKECHAVHMATGSYQLTRANTRGETCEFCHGVGGAAATTVILDPEGHGLSPSQQLQTVTAPGDTYPAYTKNAEAWGCLECHSAHDNQTVKLAGLSSNKLLKSDPNPGKNYTYYTPTTGETTQTVSQWCSSCHNANFGASSDGKTVLKGSASATVFGHASSGAGMHTLPDGYADVKLDDGVNEGPTCQQCHVADGRTGTAEFPHSSGSEPSMLKAGTDELQLDSVCSDCHNTAALP